MSDTPKKTDDPLKIAVDIEKIQNELEILREHFEKNYLEEESKIDRWIGFGMICIIIFIIIFGIYIIHSLL
jgi:uncharacterized membrane protein YukC